MSRDPFSRRTLARLIAYGSGTLVLGFVLAAFLPGLHGDRTAGPSSFSRSLQGHRALTEWLTRLEIPVIRCRAPMVLEFRPTFPVLLAEPILCFEAPSRGVETYADAIASVLARVDEAGAAAVVVLPKRSYFPDSENPDWVGQEFLDLSHAESVLVQMLPARPAGQLTPATATSVHRVLRVNRLTDVDGSPLGIEAPVIELEDPQVLRPECVVEPLLQCRQGILIGRVKADRSRGKHYVVSDPDLLNNRGLARGDHAALIHALLTDVLDADGVVVDESLHGFRSSRSALARAFGFPLVLIVLHALLLAGLFAWAQAVRFGKALTPPPALPPGKILLLQNTGRLVLAAGNHGHAVRRYLRAAMVGVADRFAFGEVPSGRALTERVAAMTRARGLPFDLPRIARDARAKELTPAEAVELALEVREWRTALERPGRTDEPDRRGPRQRTEFGA